MNKQTPLFSIDAERSVLGSLLLKPELFEDVSEIVCTDDFFKPDHKVIFDAICDLAAAGEEIDVITAGEQLSRVGQLEYVGGVARLMDIIEQTPGTSNAISYAEIVKEHSRVRALAIAAGQISARTHEREGMTSEEMLEEAERVLSSLSNNDQKAGEFESIGSILKGTVDNIDERFNSGESVTGIKTGLSDLDAMTNGLQDTDLIILAGRPGMGKSSKAMNIAENAAINENKVVAVFSLEMPKKQLAERMISSIGRIDQNRIKTGKFEPDDFDRMMGAVKKLKDSKLFIDDTAGISPSYARSKLKKIEREHGSVDLVVIDYLQLMQIKGYKEGRTNEVSEISRDLKAIAKEFNCPVIALSQLNRSLETRPNKRPINSDLRESGSIEQDADIIMFVYRDEVYNEDSPYKGVAEIIIGKHRNGPIGTCRAAFIGKYTRFENLAASAYSEMNY